MKQFSLVRGIALALLFPWCVVHMRSLKTFCIYGFASWPNLPNIRC